MTDRTKFEAMLEALINEDHEAAKDIFHNIVVGKSREIYERLLAEEFEEEEEEDAEDDSEDDAFGDDEEGEDDDMFGADDEEGEDDDMFGADDENDEFGDDEFGDEGDEGLEDRVLDLEDALDELKSEFEQLLAGEEDEPEHDDMFGGDELGDDDDMAGMDDMGGDEFGAGEEENEFQSMFEYVNKVALPKHGNNGDNNTSLFNKPKYNDMGGVAPKFGGTASGEGTKGGLLKPTTTKMDGGNQNVPGNAKAPKLQKVPAGHGSERKGTGEKAANTRSLIPGRK